MPNIKKCIANDTDIYNNVLFSRSTNRSEHKTAQPIHQKDVHRFKNFYLLSVKLFEMVLYNAKVKKANDHCIMKVTLKVFYNFPSGLKYIHDNLDEFIINHLEKHTPP